MQQGARMMTIEQAQKLLGDFARELLECGPVELPRELSDLLHWHQRTLECRPGETVAAVSTLRPGDKYRVGNDDRVFECRIATLEDEFGCWQAVPRDGYTTTFSNGSILIHIIRGSASVAAQLEALQKGDAIFRP